LAEDSTNRRTVDNCAQLDVDEYLNVGATSQVDSRSWSDWTTTA
jgi:hypothetical protein